MNTQTYVNRLPELKNSQKKKGLQKRKEGRKEEEKKGVNKMKEINQSWFVTPVQSC